MPVMHRLLRLQTPVALSLASDGSLWAVDGRARQVVRLQASYTANRNAANRSAATKNTASQEEKKIVLSYSINTTSSDQETVFTTRGPISLAFGATASSA